MSEPTLVERLLRVRLFDDPPADTGPPPETLGAPIGEIGAQPFIGTVVRNTALNFAVLAALGVRWAVAGPENVFWVAITLVFTGAGVIGTANLLRQLRIRRQIRIALHAGGAVFTDGDQRFAARWDDLAIVHGELTEQRRGMVVSRPVVVQAQGGPHIFLSPAISGVADLVQRIKQS
ncbi:MAG: hypothetical protein ACFB51_12090 [Anaerolineae bacterium]